MSEGMNILNIGAAVSECVNSTTQCLTDGQVALMQVINGATTIKTNLDQAYEGMISTFETNIGQLANGKTQNNQVQNEIGGWNNMLNQANGLMSAEDSQTQAIQSPASSTASQVLPANMQDINGISQAAQQFEQTLVNGAATSWM